MSPSETVGEIIDPDTPRRPLSGKLGENSSRSRSTPHPPYEATICTWKKPRSSKGSASDRELDALLSASWSLCSWQ